MVLGGYFLFLGLQIVRSRSDLYTLGPKVGIIYKRRALGYLGTWSSGASHARSRWQCQQKSRPGRVGRSLWLGLLLLFVLKSGVPGILTMEVAVGSSWRDSKTKQEPASHSEAAKDHKMPLG